MSVAFPSIKPSGRSVTLGSYPTKVYRSLAGTTVKRSFGNRPFGYQLSLEFANLPDTATSQIIKHYNDTAGGFTRFTLPAEVFAGMDSTLRGQLQAPGGIRWEYAGPPEVVSVYRGRSNVTITLAGEMNV
jgi:hypothetical protein